jgi:DNA end-binding protein Ku
MLFGDEVLAPDRIDELDAVGEADASQREMVMAQQLIESLAGAFDPTKYHDEYRERVLDLIERKAAGEQIAVQPQAEEASPAPDLMAALEASLAAVQSDADGQPDAEEKPAPAKPRKRAAARTTKDGDDRPKPAKARAKAKQ